MKIICEICSRLQHWHCPIHNSPDNFIFNLFFVFFRRSFRYLRNTSTNQQWKFRKKERRKCGRWKHFCLIDVISWSSLVTDKVLVDTRIKLLKHKRTVFPNNQLTPVKLLLWSGSVHWKNQSSRTFRICKWISDGWAKHLYVDLIVCWSENKQDYQGLLHEQEKCQMTRETFIKLQFWATKDQGKQVIEIWEL